MSSYDEYHRNYYIKNRQKYIEYSKNRRLKNHEKYKQSMKTYYKINRESHLKYQREYYHKNRDKFNNNLKEFNKKLRINILEYYSNGNPKCSCCNESEINFLSIDHINGGGNKHRIQLKGKNLYRWIRDNKFPEGFQVLCMNCNWGRSRTSNHICPHKMK